jgi:hypothetical protein
MAQDADNHHKKTDNPLNLDEDRLNSALRAILYRQDCPDKMVLGDYELGLLSEAEQTEVQRHLDQCPHCQTELARFAQSLADDPLLMAREVAPTIPSPSSPDPTWVESLFEFGRAWLEQETGRWRQISLALVDLGSQAGTSTALSGLMSGTIASAPAQDSLTLTPLEANFELTLLVLPDPLGGSDDLAQIKVVLTLLDRFGDFSGARVTLQWADQVRSQETNVLGEVIFANLPREQLDRMELTITLPD